MKEKKASYEQLLDELQITKILRQLRYLNAWAKQGMTNDDWENHRLKMGYTTYKAAKESNDQLAGPTWDKHSGADSALQVSDSICFESEELEQPPSSAPQTK